MASAVPAGRAGPGWPLLRSVEHLAGPGRSLGGRRPAPLPPQPLPGAGGDSMRPLWALGRRAYRTVCLGCLPHLPPSEGPCSRTTRPPLQRWLESEEIREAPERDLPGQEKPLRFPTLAFLSVESQAQRSWMAHSKVPSTPATVTQAQESRRVAQCLGTSEFDLDCLRPSPCLWASCLNSLICTMGLILSPEPGL